MIDKAVDVRLNFERVFSLGFNLVGLLGRKSKGRSERVDLLNEYWALRFAVLYYESFLHPKFDNEDEVVSFLKECIRDMRP